MLLIMKTRINWDFFGIVTSVACAIHCAVLPLIISSLPLFGVNIINNAPFEWMMIGIAFFIGSYAVLHGYRKHHKSLAPFLYFSTGFLFLLLKQFFHHAEFIFLVPAVFIILYAHFLNYRYCRQPKLIKVE
ncbi:MAG: MerC domain-containing protein, partial [Ginsengibacter sp.]